MPLSSQVVTQISWSPLGGLKGGRPPLQFGERTRDCAPGQAGKEGTHIARTGASQGFPRTAAPMGVFSRGTTRSSGSLSCGAREVRSPFHARGEGERVMALESWEGTRASRRIEEGLSRSFSGGGKPSFPSTSAGDLRELPRVPLRGKGHCGVGGASRDPAGFGAMEEGLISRGGRNARLPLRFGLRPQGPCRVGTGESGLVLSEEGNSACLSRCSGGLRPLVELCVASAGFSGRCTGVSVPLRVVPSPAGLPSKRGPGLGSFSRADRGIGVVRHVAPATGLVSNFLVRPASS